MPQEKIEAPMSGKIISVKVKVGDTVNMDDELCVLEAMKMEMPMVSPVNGKVVQLTVAPDQAVKGGQLLAVVEY